MNDKRPYSRAQLARDLGLSKASITKLAKRGMPVHSRAAAAAWRRQHLDPTWTKEGREATDHRYAHGEPRSYGLPHETWTPKMIKGVHEDLREYAEYAEIDFDAWAKPLRMVMSVLPTSEWGNVELSKRLWVQLIGEREVAFLRSRRDDPVEAQRDKHGRLAFDVENVFYMLACGLSRVMVPDDYVPRKKDLMALERDAALYDPHA